MNNQLQAFLNNEFGNVRGVNINGEAYLVGKDVVEKLGYKVDKKHSANDIIKRHISDEEDYILYNKETALNFNVQLDYKELGQRGGLLINESGFYALVLGSELESAKRFKKWVTSEVLPSIRKTGSYSINKTEKEKLLLSLFSNDPVEVANAHKQLVKLETEPLIETISEQKPKVKYYEDVMNVENGLTVTNIAKSFGMSAI